ncbi:MAG: hypothetical protein HYV96_02495 [Opitutae bacterium]|nr:hypothetical protein [Opitutae bacterium]
MSRSELRAVVDRCSPADQRYLLAYLRSKEPEFRHRLTSGDEQISLGRNVRLRATKRGLVRSTR